MSMPVGIFHNKKDCSGKLPAGMRKGAVRGIRSMESSPQVSEGCKCVQDSLLKHSFVHLLSARFQS